MFLQKTSYCLCRSSVEKLLVGASRYFAAVSTEGTTTAEEKEEPSQAPRDPFKKLNKVMRAYVERTRAYNDFMKKEEQEYQIGKRHLGNMMGVPAESFTQQDIDAAIEYLFPSGIFDKKARPFMKPPAEVFPPKKDAQFDETGRPFHFLFYTGKSNFYSILYDTVATLNKLNAQEDATIRSKKSLVPVEFDVSGSKWLTKAQLEAKLVEPLTNREYALYVSALERLLSHRLAHTQKDFIMSQRHLLMDVTKTFDLPVPEVGPDGRSYVTTRECPRKSARATVTVIKPGTGKILINGEGLDYFTTTQARNQILFPLELSGLRDRVDVVASVENGGETGQAGAVRYGIAWGIRCFVSPDMVESMRLAGLLTRDYRVRERKKPGQEGARRKFTWKKR